LFLSYVKKKNFSLRGCKARRGERLMEVSMKKGLFPKKAVAEIAVFILGLALSKSKHSKLRAQSTEWRSVTALIRKPEPQLKATTDLCLSQCN
jgi:hypothetical protein